MTNLLLQHFLQGKGLRAMAWTIFSMGNFPGGAGGCRATWSGETLDLFRAGLERGKAEGELKRLR